MAGKGNNSSKGQPKRDKMILKMPVLEGLSAAAAVDAFLESEEFYVERALRVAVEMFMNFLNNHIKLKKELISQTEINTLFLNISNIYDFNAGVLKELTELRLEGVDLLVDQVGITMGKFIPFFKLYAAYVKNYRNAQKLLTSLIKKKKAFSNFLDMNQAVAGQHLDALLLTPVNRLPQYLSFLGAVFKGMEDKASPAAKALGSAFQALLTVTTDITASLKDEAQREMVVTVQEEIFKGTISVVSPHRLVCKKSFLTVVYEKTTFHARFKNQLFVLFNDCLMFGMKGIAKHVMMLEGMEVEAAIDGFDYKDAFKLRSTLKDKTYILCAASDAERRTWVAALQTQISKWASGEVVRFAGCPEEFECLMLKKKYKKKKGDRNIPVTSRHRSSIAVDDPPAVKRALTSPSPSTTAPASSHHRSSSEIILPPPFPTPSEVAMEMEAEVEAEEQAEDATTTSDWTRALDPSSGQHYWANSATQESTWVQPKDWEDPDAPAVSTKSHWTEVPDPASGFSYYLNTKTNETQWDKPQELLETAESPAPSAGDQPAPSTDVPPAPSTDGPPAPSAGGPPAPPMGGPSAPAGAPALTSPMGGGLLGAIQAGKALKKAAPPALKPRSNTILDQIKTGATLKKASARVQPKLKDDSADGLEAALGDALSNYRQFVVDDEDEEEEDDDWD